MRKRNEAPCEEVIKQARSVLCFNERQDRRREQETFKIVETGRGWMRWEEEKGLGVLLSGSIRDDSVRGKGKEDEERREKLRDLCEMGLWRWEKEESDKESFLNAEQ